MVSTVFVPVMEFSRSSLTIAPSTGHLFPASKPLLVLPRGAAAANWCRFDRGDATSAGYKGKRSPDADVGRQPRDDKRPQPRPRSCGWSLGTGEGGPPRY